MSRARFPVFATILIGVVLAACSSSPGASPEREASAPPTSSATRGSTIAPATSAIAPTSATAPPDTSLPPPALELEGPSEPASGPPLGRLRSDGRRLWALGGDRLVRLDPVTGAVAAATPVVATTDPRLAGPSYALVAGELVLLDGAQTSLRRLDPNTLIELGAVPLPDGVHHLPFRGDLEAPWVGHVQLQVDLEQGRRTPSGASLVDLAGGLPTTTITTPRCGVNDLATGFGSVWLAVGCVSWLLRVDPATGSVQARIPLARGFAHLAIGAASVWISHDGDGLVSRLDPRTNQIVATLDLNDRSLQVTGVPPVFFHAGDVWAIGFPPDPANLPVLYRINPRNNTIVARRTTSDVSFASVGDRLIVARGGGVADVEVPAVVGNVPEHNEVTSLGVPTLEFEPRTNDEADVRDTIASLAQASGDSFARLVEHGAELAPIHDELRAAAASDFHGATLDVTDLHVDGPVAQARVVVVIDGTVASPQLPVELHRNDERWQLTRASYCTVAAAALVRCP
jgi:hypothetical protein